MRAVATCVVLLAFGFALAAGAAGVAQQRAAREPAARPPAQPRMPWGDPDLEGVWTSDNNFSVPLERPADVKDKELLEGADLENALRTRAKTIAAVADGGVVGAGPSHWYENLTARSRRSSLIIDPPDGRLPALTADARRRAAAAADARRGRGPSDSWEDRSLWDRCITVGLPSVMFPTGYNNNVQILQAPGYVTITHEMMHDTRVIPLDGRPRLSPAIRQYMGDSRARWEGATLVIEVTNFHPKTNYRGSGETLRLIERYTRTGAGRAALRGDDRRPAHVRAAVDGRARSGAAGPDVPVRVPRGQSRAREHPPRRAGRGARRRRGAGGALILGAQTS